MRTLMQIVLGRREPMAADYAMALAVVLATMVLILVDMAA